MGKQRKGRSKKAKQEPKLSKEPVEQNEALVKYLDLLKQERNDVWVALQKQLTQVVTKGHAKRIVKAYRIKEAKKVG
jgi:hypothetical protein